MTIAEFKAWLEGFEAAMGKAPTAEQWEAIKAKIAQLRASDGRREYKFPAKPYSPWWEINPISYRDDRTVPLGAH